MLVSDELRLRASAAYMGWVHDRPSRMAVDTETTGLTFYDKPFCATLAWRDQRGELVGHYVELVQVPDEAETAGWIKTMLNGTDQLIFHNAKFDMQKLQLVGLMEPRTFDTYHDTEMMAHLVDEHQRTGLKSLARELLGVQTDEEETLKKVRRELKLKKDDGYHVLPREVLIPYAVQDAVLTYMLFERVAPLVARYDDLVNLYNMERELALVLGAMEAAGMQVDVPYLEETAREYAGKALRLEVGIRNTVGRDDFNPNSPKQVAEAFEARGITNLESTSREALESLDDPLAESIVELRQVRKMHGTYLLNLIAEAVDSVVHPWFRNKTRTGRLSSGGAEA